MRLTMERPGVGGTDRVSASRPRSVRVPVALRPYLGGREFIEPVK